jgi:1,4-alpha-glucan branching enzyme
MTKKTKATTSRKRVTFEVETDAGSEVTIAGSFNEWGDSEKALVDKDGSGLYRCIMLLPPGSYEYKFVINGAWCLDPSNPSFVPNDQGTLNSLLEVQ